MPPLATTELNHKAIALMERWIMDSRAIQTYDSWRQTHFPEPSLDSSPRADPDGDGARNEVEFLTRTDPLNSTDAWTLKVALENATPTLQFTRVPDLSIEIQESSNLNSNDWRRSDLPDNRLLFPAQATTESIPLPPSETARFYRVRLIEP